MAQVVQGYLGGDLIIDKRDNLVVFFSERFVTGCPAYVHLGSIADELLALKPGEHLDVSIPGIDEIYARHAPESLELPYPEVVLYFLGTFRHSINMVIVSQEKLRQAITRAIVAV